jgi:CBS domain-containing protein
MRICDLIKDQDSCQVEVSASVIEAVHTMIERDIGAVPVVRHGKLMGIFSERDLLKRVVAEGRDPTSTCVAEVMTDDPLAVDMNEEIETCLTLMRRHNYRHLPVCYDGHLVGMVSLRDVLLHDVDERDEEVRIMRAYMHSLPDA